MIGICIDITDRKRTEEALRDSEERYRTRFNALIEGFCVIEMVFDEANKPVDYRFLEVNQAFEAQTGLHDAQGKLMRDLAPEHEEHWFEIYGKIALTGEPARFEDEARALNRWFEVRAFRVGGQESRKVAICFNDITERKQAEKERQRLTSELTDRVAELQAVLDVAPIAIWIAHDPQCLRITGNSYADELIMQVPRGSNISATARPGEAAVTFRVLRNDSEMKPEELPAQVAAVTGKPVEAELLDLVFTDGRVVTLIEGAVPLFDAEGNVRGSVTAGADVTLLKRAEEDLRKSRDELEQRVLERTAELSDAKENLETINEELEVEISEHENTEKNLLKAKETAEAAVEAKAAFLANMSHELRTPMNAVIGFSNLLLDESLTPDQKDYIERIRVGGEALLGLINDVLDFSKMEKNKMEQEHQPLSLRALVDESLDMVVVQARDKGLNLAFTISHGTSDTIIGDQGRLRQVLVNLLTNAVKFTDVGEVSVSISSKAKEDNKHQILFSVRDSGIGIPKDKMDMLFQPFSQVEATISSHRGGTGLGLAISKRLVDLMGGKIWVESEQGKGSIFSFTIEAEVDRGLPVESEIPAQSVENLAEQHPMRILVAEDVPSNQKVLVEMLKRMGYRADMAADGIEVLQALERQPYDLILMDVKMPEMDGITAAKEIRRLWPNKRPKIVAITAYAMEGDRGKCLEAGMDGYISKPVKKGELAEVLKRCAQEIQQGNE
jgi:PAS domain S-box-containing protein